MVGREIYIGKNPQSPRTVQAECQLPKFNADFYVVSMRLPNDNNTSK